MSSKYQKLHIMHIGLMTGGIIGVWSFISGLVEGLSGFVDPNTFDANQALGPLPWIFITALLQTLIITWYIQRTQLAGKKLGIVVFILIFGVQFFMSQIETIYFLDSIQIPRQLIFGQILAGIGVGFLVALLSVRYRNKLDELQDNPKNGFINLPRNVVITQFTILAFVYTLIYYFFGYFIAWQFPALREYYSGSTDLVPFLSHMQVQLAEEPGLIIFQIFRGYLWAGIAYLATMNLPKAKTWERFVIVGLVMSIGLAFPILVPQKYMPTPVRLRHFPELLSSNFVFGVIASWLFTRKNTHPISNKNLKDSTRKK